MYSKIINIARDLFLQRGIRSVTMDEIAAEAGISKRTLYEMFATKEDLLEKLLENMRTEHSNTVRQIIETTSSCIVGILNLMKFVTEEIKNEMAVKARECFFIDLKKFYPKVAEKNNEYKEIYLLFMAKHLEKGVEQQTVRSDLNLNLVSTLLIAQVEGLDGNKSIKQFHPSEIFTTIIISFCRGISTEKGLKEIESFVLENNLT
jgi:AcrR family transcriptional regulator